MQASPFVYRTALARHQLSAGVRTVRDGQLRSETQPGGSG